MTQSETEILFRFVLKVLAVGSALQVCQECARQTNRNFNQLATDISAHATVKGDKFGIGVGADLSIAANDTFVKEMVTSQATKPDR